MVIDWTIKAMNVNNEPYSHSEGEGAPNPPKRSLSPKGQC